MNNAFGHIFHRFLTALFRAEKSTAIMLVIFCPLVSLPVFADECLTLPAQSDGQLGVFEQKIRSLKTVDTLNQKIQNDLCAKNSIYAFLTGEPAYHYGRCFIPANKADNFWNADHKKSQSLLWTFRTQCIDWAEKRYQPWTARLVKQERRLQAKKPLQSPERKHVKAAAKEQHKAMSPKQHTASKQQAMLQAKAEARNLHREGKLQWHGESKRAQHVNTELAAYLFSTELLKTEPSAGHLQQYFNEMMGRPQVISVTSTGKENEYRVRIQSGYHDYTVDALVRSEKPLTEDITPWLLFTQQDQKLIPVTAVLQTPKQVITAAQLEGSELPLVTLPDNNVTRLPASTGSTQVQVQLQCVPHDGGHSMPLSHCLKPDGEISILTSEISERFVYEDLSRKQRDYQTSINPPFVLLVRTGNANRRGEIRLRVTDTTQTENPTLFDDKAMARHDSLLVYSEQVSITEQEIN